VGAANLDDRRTKQSEDAMKELDEMIELEDKELKRIEEAIEKARKTGKDIPSLVKMEMDRERTLGGWRMLLALKGKIGNRYNDA